MSVCVIYDDRAGVGEEIAGLVGVARFSRVLYRKRSLLDHAKELLRDAGVDEFLHLVRESDVDNLRAHAQRAGPGTRYLYFPACIVPTDLLAARAFLKKIQYSRRDLVIPVQLDPAGPPVLLLGERGLTQHLDTIARCAWPLLVRESAGANAPTGAPARSGRAALSVVRNQADLRDISEPGRFLAYLSSNFDARHFNQVRHDGSCIIKRSKDQTKLEREYNFLRLLDGPMQAFFLRPFDFTRDDPASADAQASYRMERLRVPDMAIQWIHGALSIQEFRTFLGRIEEYFRLRPVKLCSAGEFGTLSAAMFAGKIRERSAQLRALLVFQQLGPLIERCTPYRSIEHQLARWESLFEKHAAKLGPPRLAFTHGDLCFSNILYDKRTGVTKLIDPRGAEDAAGLFGHPWYDAAKLSHSVLGDYDFLNQGVTGPVFQRDLSVMLEAPPHDLSPHKQAFGAMMAGLGFDPVLLRVLEASLFLSMLPLHSDAPRKVLALFVNGCRILDEVESLA